jgi:uncharacterized membrane protein
MAHWLKVLFVSCAFLLSGNTTAYSGLKFCNKTVKPFSVALGYITVADRQWHSTGWYNINPGDCGDVLPGDLDNRYYYFYAFRDDNYVIKGNDEGLVPDEFACESFPSFALNQTNQVRFAIRVRNHLMLTLMTTVYLTVSKERVFRLWTQAIPRTLRWI